MESYKQYKDSEYLVEVSNTTHTKIENNDFMIQLIPTEGLSVYVEATSKGGVKAKV